MHKNIEQKSKINGQWVEQRKCQYNSMQRHSDALFGTWTPWRVWRSCFALNINKYGNLVILLSVILIAASYVKQKMWKYTEIDQNSMLTIMHSEPVSRKSCHEASLNVPDALSKKKKVYKYTFCMADH